MMSIQLDQFKGKLCLVFLLSLIIHIQSFSQVLDPPVVSDITTCEGGSTLITPIPPTGETPTQEVIASEDFDGQGSGYTSTGEFNDGSSDHFGVTDGSNISQDNGDYSFEDGTNMFFAGEDVDDNGGPGVLPAVFSLNPISITGVTNIEFCFDLAAGATSAYDDPDSLKVVALVDGLLVEEMLCFNYLANGDPFNEPLLLDTDCDGVGDGTELTTTGQQFCFTLDDADLAGASSLEYQIIVRMDAAKEEIAFDNIVVSGISTAEPTSYNFYDGDPLNGGNLLAGNVLSYDPMTTLADSPESIWVTTTDEQGQESEAVEVLITILENPMAEAGEGFVTCGLTDVLLSATEANTGTGMWSGGLGTFADDMAANTTYTPDVSELGTLVELSWTVSTEQCGDAVDEVQVIYVADDADAEFYYPVTTICPGDGFLNPMHLTGMDGIYSVTGGDPDDVAIDPLTGIIDVANTANGEYTITNTISPCGNLIITAIYDGPLNQGQPKGVELYALNTVTDMTRYGISSVNNGAASSGIEFEFPSGNFEKGDYIYIANSALPFQEFFGFFPDYIAGAMAINGDDVIELYCDGIVIDVFGEVGVDGTGTGWEYLDGWAYRVDQESPNYGSFAIDQFYYSGINALDNATINDDAQLPIPIGTFVTDDMGICPLVTYDQDVAIGDFEMPEFVCPGDMTVSLDAGECGTFAQILDIEIMDNCSPDIDFVQISGPAHGDYLSKEDSPFTVVFEAMEENGNVIECSYQIFVVEYPFPTNTMACNGQINLSLDENCQATLNSDMILEGGPYGCYDDFEIEVTLDDIAVGTSVESPDGTGNHIVLDGTYGGALLKVTINNPDTGISCWGYLKVEDKIAPMIVCEDYTLNCGDNTEVVEPMVEESCSDYFLDFDEEVIEGTCTDEFSQVIIRTWKVVDGSGNVGNECIQTITVGKEDFADIELPLNYDSLPGNNAALECSDAGVVWNSDANGIPLPHNSGNLIGTGYPGGLAGCAQVNILYDDKVIETCGTSFKVIRTWTILDWCSSQTITHIQIIKVLDTQGPIIETLDDVIVATDELCDANYKLPEVLYSDNCNDVEVSFAAEAGQILGDYLSIVKPALAYGYTITATATDACGNSSSTSFEVSFVDKTPPIVVANTVLTTTLAADGIAKIYAESFDDGSYDACTDVGFAVRRMGSVCTPQDYFPPNGDDNFQFNEIVHFCCADTEENQMVVFRVCDDADDNNVYGSAGDNCNTAMVEVIVQDKLAPTLSCPDNTTISCIDVAGIDWEDEALVNNMFGEATAFGTCDITVEQTVALNQECPDGTEDIGLVIRTFTATTVGGTKTCSQIISIKANPDNMLTCDKIAFDIDASIFDGVGNSKKRKFWYDDPSQPDPFNGFVSHWCAVNDNINNNTDDIDAIEIDCNEGFQAPEVLIDMDNLCTEAGINLSVDTFNFAGGACKKYLLHYEVIDQCVFDENYVDPITGELDPYTSDNGYFELFLEIDAFDYQGPDLTCNTLEIEANSCTGSSESIQIEATDLCSDEAYFGYQWRIDLDSDGGVDYPANGWYKTKVASASAFGQTEFPIGTHRVYWLVSDGCGNISTCFQTVIISPNTKAPTPYCHSGLVTTVQANGSVEVWASDLDLGSFDNCTAQEDLIISFSQDINDTYVNYTCDQVGFQFVQIWVTDTDGNQDYCSTSILVQENDSCDDDGQKISGTVSSSYDYMNEKSQMMLSNGVNEYLADETDNNGIYDIAVGQINNETTIKPYDNQNILMGVTTLDIILIQKHILGLATITDPELLIAADVNNSGNITGSDLVQIRKVILGYQENFVNNTSWNFYPSSIDIDSELDIYNIPQYIQVFGAENYDFTSIKIADVNPSYNVQSNGLDMRNLDREDIRIETEYRDGQYYTYFFNDNIEQVEGIQLSLRGISEDAQIISGRIELTSEDYRMADGEFLVSSHDVSGQGSFLFGYSQKENKRPSLGSDIDAEIYLQEAANIEARRIKFEQKVNENISIKVSPNPFYQSTQLEIIGDLEKDATYSVFHISGKMIQTGSISNNLQDINIIDGIESGVYFLEIENGNRKYQEKLLIIK